jgi:hypothetical protein
MTSFPTLKTLAVAQYPAGKTLRFQNLIFRFLDGTEQRCRDSAGPLHRWVIQLQQLDEYEMAAIEQFFADNQGSFGSFAFTDPWDGTVYPNCSIAVDGLILNSLAEMQGRTSVTLIENRG